MLQTTDGSDVCRVPRSDEVLSTLTRGLTTVNDDQCHPECCAGLGGEVHCLFEMEELFCEPIDTPVPNNVEATGDAPFPLFRNLTLQTPRHLKIQLV